MPTVSPQSSFTFDATVFANTITALQRPELDKPVALALVDTAKSAIVKASSLIARRTKLASSVVKSRLSYDHVKIGDYHAIVRSSRKPIPLIDFPGTDQGKAGVRINVWGKNQTLRGAFIERMRSGHRGVYRRVYTARLPIRQLWGPTIYGTFATPEVQTLIKTTMLTRLDAALRRRIASAKRQRARR